MYHHQKERCPRCKLHLELCICAQIPKISTATRLLLVIHAQEIAKPSNSGWLACDVLPNSEMRVRGEHDKPLVTEGMDRSDYQNILLYPDTDAEELSESFLEKLATNAGAKKPVQLIVPDGTWGQARRTGARISAAFPKIPHAKLPFLGESQYRLRKETNIEGLSTFEAIARAFGILEGKKVQEEMEKIFFTMVERLLFIRGKLDEKERAEFLLRNPAAKQN